MWEQSAYGEGEPLARRTFYNYRNAIEELFKITIKCNSSTFEYYIDDAGDSHAESVTDWMLNTASMSNVLTDARDVADRVFLEDVPSARHYLGSVIGAMKENRGLKFNYSPYTRAGRPNGVMLEPYFLKIFRNRWYVTGRNVKEEVIKTYALDRMSDVAVEGNSFEIPYDFDAEAYFADSFGIMFTKGETKKVTIKADARQAKYFRALPLHHSQSEMVHDKYSVFTYRLRLTPDLVQELLSYGPKITVLAPQELRAMMKENLKEALANYES